MNATAPPPATQLADALATELVPALATFGARVECAADAPFAAALYASTRADLLGSGQHAALAAQLIGMQQRLRDADYRQRFPAAVTLILHASANGAEPLGRLVVERQPAALRLIDIALQPPARAGGIGTAVLRLLQQWAAQHGLAIHLSVQQRNAPARRLYAALGWHHHAFSGHAEELVWRA